MSAAEVDDVRDLPPISGFQVEMLLGASTTEVETARWMRVVEPDPRAWMFHEVVEFACWLPGYRLRSLQELPGVELVIRPEEVEVAVEMNWPRR